MESKTLDFDEEARSLWARLNLAATSVETRTWSMADPIFCHASGGGKIYVGNQNAAGNLKFLRSLNITGVVNCTTGFSKIPDFHKDDLNYYNFPISHWEQHVNKSNASVIDFSKPMFGFIEDKISRGESVLVHCLAGAHRAGTTGVACLIHFAGLDVPAAIAAAKMLRPIIDPIGQLPQFLHRLKKAYDARDMVAAVEVATATTTAKSAGGGRDEASAPPTPTPAPPTSSKEGRR